PALLADLPAAVRRAEPAPPRSHLDGMGAPFQPHPGALPFSHLAVGLADLYDVPRPRGYESDVRVLLAARPRAGATGAARVRVPHDAAPPGAPDCPALGGHLSGFHLCGL